MKSSVYGGKFGEVVKDHKENLDAWLVHYNTERPHRGYRNLGRRPIETIEEHLTVGHES